MRYLLIFLSFGLAHAATITLSGSVCAGSVDTVSGAFILNCAPSSPPPVPAPPPIVTATSYPLAAMTMADECYVSHQAYFYSAALDKLPGSHQLWYDLPTNAQGLRWAQLSGSAQQAFQLQINTAINNASYNCPPYNGYAGPLVPIYNALVAAKLAGG